MNRYICNMSNVLVPVHAVINTYCRRMTIFPEHEELLYLYIWGILKTRYCHLYRTGGIENHIHILFDLDTRCALMDVMRNIKRESSKWMKDSGLFPEFEGWGKEYFAIGRSPEDLQTVIGYIQNQKEHHNRISFEEELKNLTAKGGMRWSDYMLT